MVATVERMVLKTGWALGLGTNDETGRPWDFTRAGMRNKAARLFLEDKPVVLMGSPPCTDWSVLMNLNWDKVDPEVVAERKVIARVHLELCAKLCSIQREVGRRFIHEHPSSSKSWHEQIERRVHS